MNQRIEILKELAYRELINRGMIRNKTFVVNGKNILMRELNKSGLLKGIAVNGFESYENEVVTLIKNYPWQVDYFMDIGANIGFYCILCCCYHKSISAIAVEPFPENVEYMRRMKHENKLKFHIIEMAIDNISDSGKEFYFPIAKNSSRLSISASLINSFKGTGGVFNDLPYKYITVETMTLSEITSSYNGSLLIKLDCEGNELPILESSKTLLTRENVDFIIEILINDKDKQEIFAIMKRYGYQGFLITNAGLVHEERPLTFPNPNRKNRTIWANHFFTKKRFSEIKEISLKYYGYWI